MSRKAALAAVPSLALALMFAVPCGAMSVVPAPRNSDGTPRFSEPNPAPRSFSSGPGQVTTTFGNGSFSFSTTNSFGWGAGNQGYYGPPVTSPYYTGPSGSGFSDPGFPSPILPGSGLYPVSPFSYFPPPATRIDPNKPR